MFDGDRTIDNPLHNNGGRDKRGRFTTGHSFGFRQGRSGNPKGRPKSATLSDAYRRMLASVVPGDIEERTFAEIIAHKVVMDAAFGNLNAASELANRTEGRPRQSVEITEQPTDLAARLRIHGLTIEEAEREAEEVLDELHNLRVDTHEIS
jgi:Family of unknown function (DUF5681)